MPKQSSNPSSETTTFMMKEYERLSKVLSDEDRETEQRVNFFLTLFTASIGIIAFLFQLKSISSDDLATATLAVLVILLALGMTTQTRLSMRAVHHRSYGKMMKEIQDYFANRDTDIAKYINLQRDILKKPSDKSAFALFFIDRLRGTLTELVALINSLLCGGITAISLFLGGFTFREVILLSILVTIIARIFIQFFSERVKKIIYPFFR